MCMPLGGLCEAWKPKAVVSLEVYTNVPYVCTLCGCSEHAVVQSVYVCSAAAFDQQCSEPQSASCQELDGVTQVIYHASQIVGGCLIQGPLLVFLLLPEGTVLEDVEDCLFFSFADAEHQVRDAFHFRCTNRSAHV